MNDGVGAIRAQKAFATGKPHTNQVDDGPPVPIPPSKSVIHLPSDQYLHLGASTEWWWHIGTLKAGDRIFGFEINAASFGAFGFTQVMLTDVKNNKHFQQTVPYLPPVFDPKTWAQHDRGKDWFVNLGQVSMHAPKSDPTKNMKVKAGLTDEATNTTVNFDLTLSQEGLCNSIMACAFQTIP
jgi:hypothetical protein